MTQVSNAESLLKEMEFWGEDDTNVCFPSINHCPLTHTDCSKCVFRMGTQRHEDFKNTLKLITMLRIEDGEEQHAEQVHTPDKKR
jgi:hypothetical protein